MNRRKAKSSVDEAKLHEVDEQWFWGNVRGGGGAPLKDKQGNALANLKGVLNGAVEVDYSVSPGKNIHNDKNYNGDYGRYNEPHAPDAQLNQQSYSNQHRSIRDRNDNRGNGRGSLPSKANRDDEHERFIPGLSDIPAHQPQPSNRNNPYNIPLSARRDDSSAVDAAIRMDGPPSPAAALRNNNYRRQQQDSHPEASSPKKFMGALRELTSGLSDCDRNDKLKKQQAYQAMLKAQIEEKERKKKKEKEEEEAIKRKELVEYYRSINKPVPLELLSPQRKQNQPPGQEQFGGSGNRYHQDAFGDRYLDDNNSLQNMNNGNHNIPPKKNCPRNDDYEMNRGHNQYNDVEVEYTRKPPRRDHNGNNPDSDKFVTVQEYDKLSRLCDKLLHQQEQLHSEIRKQADIIEDLKQNDNGKKKRNPKTLAGVGQKQNGRVRSNVYDDDVRDSVARAANKFSSAAQREKPYRQNRDQMYDRGESRDASIDDDIQQRRFSLPRRAVSFDAGDSPHRVKIVDLGPRNDSRDEIDKFSDEDENSVGGMRKLNLPPRPSSMYEVGSPRRRLSTITSNTGDEDPDSPREVAQSSRGRREARDNKKNPPVVKKPAPKKPPKVAFGGAIKPTKSRIDLNKPKQVKTKSAVDAVSAAVGMNKGRRNAGGKGNFNRNSGGDDNSNHQSEKQDRRDFQGGNRHSSIKKTALNIVNHNHPTHDEDHGGGGGFGGFAKLQQSIKGGPIVAVHEEESHSSYKRDAPQGASMELRGQSEYFSVADDADVLGGDQLDRLLVQARNAR